MSNPDDEGIEYWLRWQTPICALTILAPSLLASYVIRKSTTAPLYSDHLWKSRWRYLNPIWILIYRVFALICLSWILFEIVSVEGVFAFYFYTQWTFSLVIVYFALGTVVSAYGCWMHRMKIENGEREKFLRGDEEGGRESVGYANKEIKGNARLQSHYSQEEFQQTAGFWGYLMQIIYQTCAGAVILTDIVFWCVIVPFLSNSHLGLNMGI